MRRTYRIKLTVTVDAERPSVALAAVEWRCKEALKDGRDQYVPQAEIEHAAIEPVRRAKR